MTSRTHLQKHMELYIGLYDLTGISRTLDSLMDTMDMIEIGNWGNDVIPYTSDGQREIGLRGYQALLDDADSALFLPITTTEQYITLAICASATPSVGDMAYAYTAVLMDDSINIDNKKGVIQISAMPASASFNMKPFGLLLYPKTTISNTVNGASIDNGAGTTAGYLANLHILSSTSGNYAFTIKHSTNGSNWSTLGSFTSDGSAAASETLTGTSTVNRYVRFTATKTAGSCVAVCSFVRQ